MAEASGGRTPGDKETCRPPVLKIIQRVLNGDESSLLYNWFFNRRPGLGCAAFWLAL